MELNQENRRPTILIVEDEENLQEALKLNLELEGYEVSCVGTGLEALKKLDGEMFDLVIMDVMLPEVDGITVTESLRLQHNEVPILIVSAKSSGADRVMGLKKGADDYLVKPFNLEELFLRVEKLIDKNKRIGLKSTLGNSYEFGGNFIDFKAQ